MPMPRRGQSYKRLSPASVYRLFVLFVGFQSLSRSLPATSASALNLPPGSSRHSGSDTNTPRVCLCDQNVTHFRPNVSIGVIPVISLRKSTASRHRYTTGSSFGRRITPPAAPLTAPRTAPCRPPARSRSLAPRSAGQSASRWAAKPRQSAPVEIGSAAPPIALFVSASSSRNTASSRGSPAPRRMPSGCARYARTPRYSPASTVGALSAPLCSWSSPCPRSRNGSRNARSYIEAQQRVKGGVYLPLTVYSRSIRPENPDKTSRSVQPSDSANSCRLMFSSPDSPTITTSSPTFPPSVPSKSTIMCS